MRFFFNAEIIDKEEGPVIEIPFNVWEVCKMREVIQGDIVLDNGIYSCELQPLKNGMYEIVLSDPKYPKLSKGEKHQTLLHISGSLIKMDQNSPYSFNNPIREITDVEIIRQPGDGLCGQTCVAMLAGVTIADVIRVMDCREWQGTMGRVISALNYYGIDHTDIITYTCGDTNVVLPKCCIMMEKMGRYSHYLIYFDGKYYDPSLGVFEEYDLSKLLGYLEIFC